MTETILIHKKPSTFSHVNKKNFNCSTVLCTFKTSLTTCERFHFDHGPWILNNFWIHDNILEPERKSHLIKLPNGAGGREKVS